MAANLKRRAVVRQDSIRTQAWRIMRIRREFTAYDIAEAVKVSSIKVLQLYIQKLCRCGVLRQTAWKSGGVVGRFNAYRLVRNLGPLSPQVCADGRLYDPNSETFIEQLQKEKAA
ncbi:MAG: hypothetical protein ACK4Q4_00580 [Rhodocyclaceae bacterium]